MSSQTMRIGEYGWNTRVRALREINCKIVINKGERKVGKIELEG